MEELGQQEARVTSELETGEEELEYMENQNLELTSQLDRLQKEEVRWRRVLGTIDMVHGDMHKLQLRCLWTYRFTLLKNEVSVKGRRRTEYISAAAYCTVQ